MWCLVDNSNSVIVWAANDKPTATDCVKYLGMVFPTYNATNSQVIWLEIENYKHGKYKYVDGDVVSNPDYYIDLTPIRAKIWEDIKEYRDHLVQTGGYKVNPHWYHSDTFSRTQQMGLVMMGAGMPAGILWKTLDNGYIPMTPTLAGQIFIAAATQDSALFAKALEHKAAIDASSDPLSYDWTLDWPENYKGG